MNFSEKTATFIRADTVTLQDMSRHWVSPHSPGFTVDAFVRPRTGCQRSTSWSTSSSHLSPQWMTAH